MAGRKPKPLENTLKRQWVVKAIELMKEGYSNSYIRQYIASNKKGSTSEKAIDSVITDANAEIVASQFNKASELIPIHIDRYNRQIRRLLAVKDADDLQNEDPEYQYDPEEYYKLREKKIRAYIDCVNTMYQKEELLQFHSKNFTIEINTEEKVEIRESRPKFDLSKLSFEEQLELFELIKQARKTENELAAIITVVKDEVTVTEDVEHEVVEQPNVELIKIEEKPKPPVRSPVSHFDPTIKLRETLEKLAAKRFQDAGGTLTEEEEKLIK